MMNERRGVRTAVIVLLVVVLVFLALALLAFFGTSLEAKPTASESGARHTVCTRLGNMQGVNGKVLGIDIRIKFADMAISEGYCIRKGGGKPNKIVSFEQPAVWHSVTTEASAAGWSTAGFGYAVGPKLYGLRTGLVMKRVFKFKNCLLKYLPICRTESSKVKFNCYAGAFGTPYCWYFWPELARQGRVG
jgi:hypothetical protein